jgi:hypothetical protein
MYKKEWNYVLGENGWNQRISFLSKLASLRKPTTTCFLSYAEYRYKDKTCDIKWRIFGGVQAGSGREEKSACRVASMIETHFMQIWKGIMKFI